MSRSMTRLIGWLLLAGTIGVVSCQALFTSGREASTLPPAAVGYATPEAPAAARQD